MTRKASRFPTTAPIIPNENPSIRKRERIFSGIVLAPSLKIGDILFVSAAVILVSVLAALQPAFKAARMEPVDALRHV